MARGLRRRLQAAPRRLRLAGPARPGILQSRSSSSPPSPHRTLSSNAWPRTGSLRSPHGARRWPGGLSRRLLLLCAAAAVAVAPAAAQAAAAAAAAAPKVLRYAFPVAETGFDPAQMSDIYSHIVTAHIFESPLRYDHLARPFKLKPSTAAGDARGVGRLPHLHLPHPAGHLLRRRPGVRGHGRASSSPRTTSTRSSASPTRR